MNMGEGISTTDDLLSDPSFRKWAEGTATKQEADIWDGWCRKNESNRRLAVKAQAELLGLDPRDYEHTDAGDEWMKLFGRIKEDQQIKLNSHRKASPLMWGYRAAVIIFVTAITSFLALQWQSNNEPVQQKVVWQEVSTGNAEQKRITLTDGSSIVLSSNSTIVYSDGWTQNSEVEIRLQGEAYFSIPHRETRDKPFFRVRTSDGMVLVTGTKFVVDADESRTRVVLEEGSVNIERALPADKSEKKTIKLEPDQLAEFNNELVTIKNVNTEVYTSWTSHKLVLDNTPFRFLAEKMEKTYGVEVEVNDSGLYERRLTGTLNFRGLDHLLQAVSEVLEIEVNQTGNKVIFEPDANDN